MKPNILLITTDQQHWDTIGAFNDEISTPNLDRLVKEGTTFKKAYCPNPTCTPSRASIITGKYPSQHGAWAIGTKLDEAEPTLGDALGNNGYETALIGKAHFQPLKSTEEYPSLEAPPLLQDLDFWRTFNEKFYGFDHIELARNHTNEWLVGQHYAIWMEEKGCLNWRDYFMAPTGTMDPADKYHWKIPEEFHYNTWIAERTNEKLAQYKENDEDFFMWSSFLDPHPPYLVPEPWDKMYDPDKLTLPTLVPGEHDTNPPHFQKTQEENPDFSMYHETEFGNIGYYSYANVTEQEARENMAVYYGMISMLDKYVGKILDQLDALGLADNTIIVFTTDHGQLFGQHGIHDKGGFLYEDLLKIPMIVRYPDVVPANHVSDAMQSLIDFAPTVLSFTQTVAPEMKMSGVDQSSVWRGEVEAARDHIICEYRTQPTKVHQRSYVNERYKLTVYFNEEYGELFDLQEDPQEIRNLWDEPSAQSLKQSLMLRYVWAELGKEILPMKRTSGA